MINPQVLYQTKSICPICMKKIPAQRVRLGHEVFIRKTCEIHGNFESIIWRGFTEINDWIPESDQIQVGDAICPDNCGLCPDHLQKTCCVLLNITDKCDLNCRFCLANQNNNKEDPTFQEICNSLNKIIEKGKTLVQFSGGEPTLRNDLPEIIKTAKETGAKYVQLNSNGIRLGEDIDFLEKLAGAGLSFVFMQFDGTNDYIFEKLRNKPLLKIKQQAIENCSKFNIGVTLVPTLVRDVNLTNLGDLLRYAISQSPKVRGIHFQPVSYLGKIPHLPENRDRITLDELVFEIVKQSNGLITANDLLPSTCDHALCGFHGDFVVNKNQLIPLSKSKNKENKNCCNPLTAEKNREFVARRWLRPIDNAENTCCGDLHDMDYFLQRVKANGFTITAMAFQDAGNIDFSRLRKCSFHVYDNNRLTPFCAHYLTGWKQ